MSVTLWTPDPADAAASASLEGIARAAFSVDGYQPFNEQAELDLAAGRRSARLVRADGESGAGIVGAGILGAGELDLVIEPDARRRGYGNAALALLLADPAAVGPLTAWAHGDHPAARILASRHGFEAVRTLLQLRLFPLGTPAPGGGGGGDGGSEGGGGVSVEAFRPGTDDEDWVALNARVFAGHPEQGRITLADLADRQAEAWFDAGDFLLARDESGRVIGYNWLKIEPAASPRIGEIYVIGVSPDAVGRGLGRALMNAGLARLHERGCVGADLYVEADNVAAVRLYRSLGFTDHTVDVQYRRAES
jgi:mycothiol synthase